MCTVTEEQLAQWEADYEADVTDMYMSDQDRFKRVLAKLGFVFVGKEKGPESSDPEPRCGLCEQTYKACRCIPF